MRWFKRRRQAPTALDPVRHDGVTRNRYSAYWWVPGCMCHWSAGIDADYCDFCKFRSSEIGTPPEGSAS